MFIKGQICRDQSESKNFFAKSDSSKSTAV